MDRVLNHNLYLIKLFLRLNVTLPPQPRGKQLLNKATFWKSLKAIEIINSGLSAQPWKESDTETSKAATMKYKKSGSRLKENHADPLFSLLT